MVAESGVESSEVGQPTGFDSGSVVLAKETMGILTDGFRTHFRPAETTAQEIGQYVSETTVDSVITRIATSGYGGLGKLCYAFGGGSLPRSSYTNLAGKVGVQVAYFESVLPHWLRFLPSYRGLVRIDDPSALRDVVDRLTDQAMVTVFVFDATLEAAFLASAQEAGRDSDHGFGVKRDPGYLIYVVDADRYDSPTGMFHFLSYGAAGPWVELFDKITESEH